MSTGSSISTPGEARHSRRVALALDLAVLNSVLSLVAIGVPLLLSLSLSQLAGVMDLMVLMRLITAILMWLSHACTALGIASAILLVGAPRQMRCFTEASLFAVVALASALITLLGMVITLPRAVVLIGNSYVISILATLLLV